ncbi:unnamed protein product [Urochloa humidicola]
MPRCRRAPAFSKATLRLRLRASCFAERQPRRRWPLKKAPPPASAHLLHHQLPPLISQKKKHHRLLRRRLPSPGRRSGYAHGRVLLRQPPTTTKADYHRWITAPKG